MKARSGTMKVRRIARRERGHRRGVAASREGVPYQGAEERGAILVIFTVALAALLLLAALSVDIGNEAQTKQHVVNAAQNAALSAVVDLAGIPNNDTSAGVASAESQAVSDVEQFATSNNPALAGADWDSCGSAVTQSEGAYRVIPYTGADCIGFFQTPGSTGPNGIAVAIPAQYVQFAFGPVGGVKGAAVSSLAAAAIGIPTRSFALPFGVSYGTGAGLQCLEFSASTSCTGFALSGSQEGLLNNPRYVVLDNPQFSTSASKKNVVIEENVDLGVDHALTTYSPAGGQGLLPSTPPVCDVPSSEATKYGCAQTDDSPPYDNGNAVVIETGQTSGDLQAALITGVSTSGCPSGTLEARLLHPSDFSATSDTSACSTTGAAPGPYLSPATLASLGAPAGKYDGVHITQYLVGGTSSPGYEQCYQGADYGSSPSSPDPNSAAIDAPYTPPAGYSSGAGATVWNPELSPQPSGVPTGDPCFASYLATAAAGSTAIFGGSSAVASGAPNSSIVYDPRFGVVPLLGLPASGGVGPCPSGSTTCDIFGFDYVFMYQIYPKAGGVGAVLAWVFPPDLVQPVDVTGSAPGSFYTGGAYSVALCSLVAGNC